MCGLNIASNVCLINVSLKLKSYEIHLLLFFFVCKSVVSFKFPVVQSPTYPEGSGAVDILC